MESQSYFSCGRRAAQFHPALIVVSPLNAPTKLMQKKHNNASRKTYSFLEATTVSEENLEQDKYDICD